MGGWLPSRLTQSVISSRRVRARGLQVGVGRVPSRGGTLVLPVNTAQHEFPATTNEALVFIAPLDEFRVARRPLFDVPACHTCDYDRDCKLWLETPGEACENF